MDVDADAPMLTACHWHRSRPIFKPATSYRWQKTTSAPNPYLAPMESKLRHAEDEYALKTTTPERKRELRDAIAQLRAEVGTLKKLAS